MKYFQISPQQAADSLGSDLNRGLNTEQVSGKREIFGANRTSDLRQRTFLSRFITLTKDYTFVLLIVAAIVSMIVSFVLEQFFVLIVDVVVILLAILFCVFRVLQETRAGKILMSLQQKNRSRITAIRNGETCTVDVADLVPGDILLLQAGDLVPADCRFVEGMPFKVVERVLTGKPDAVDKHDMIISGDNHTVDELCNMVFAGTSVVVGAAKVIVTDIGDNTRINKNIEQNVENPEDSVPLQSQLQQMAKILALPALVLCALFLLIGTLQGRPFADVLLTAATLLFGSAPASFTALSALVLAFGVQKFHRNNMLIRHLGTIEELAEVTVICSDKTGTLTQNDMHVEACYAGGEIAPAVRENFRQFAELILYGSMCNNTALEEHDGQTVYVGDATEGAILKLLAAMGESKTYLDIQYPRMGEIPFDSERKCMTAIHVIDGRNLVIVKGAPESVLNKCAIADEILEQYMQADDQLASAGLRVLAVAVKEIEMIPPELFADEIEKDLVPIGLIGIKNVPRDETLQALSLCRKGGIRTIMFTEDHPMTATATAREMGILGAEEHAMTGLALAEFSEKEFSSVVQHCNAYARISPEQKESVIRELQRQGDTVMVTGDVVSDATVLEAADVGCAIAKGTAVTKSSADLVLTDNRFSTLLRAICQGRGVCVNIKRIVSYLMGITLAEILLLLGMALLFFDLPLLPIHLLWLNVIVFSLPAIGLGVEKARNSLMNRQPHNRKRSFVSKKTVLSVLLQGVLAFVAVLLAYLFAVDFLPYSEHELLLSRGNTAAFITFAFSQIWFSFSLRSSGSVLKIGLFSNKTLLLSALLAIGAVVFVIVVPGVNLLFGFASLSFTKWIVALGASFIPLLVEELLKFFGK